MHNGSEIAQPPSPRTRPVRAASVSTLEQFDLEAYMFRKHFGAEAQAYLRAAVKAPSRHISARVSSNVRYPFPRLGLTFGLESRSVEFAGALTNGYRPDLVYMCEQPPKQTIADPKQPSVSIVTTPDLLVFTESGVEVIELKPCSELALKVKNQPNKYQELEDGSGYRSRLAEMHFKNLGFIYKIITEDQISPKFVQFAENLHPYLTGQPSRPFENEETQLLLSWVARNPGIKISEIPAPDGGRAVEIGLFMLARAQLFTNWSEVDCTDLPSMRLFPSPQDESAFYRFLERNRPKPADLTKLGYYLRPGCLVEIDRVRHKVTKLTKDAVELTPDGGKPTSMSLHNLLRLRPRIGKIYGAEMTFEKGLQTASPTQRQIYYQRERKIQPYLPGGQLEGKTPKCRTTRRLLDKYRHAIGCGRPGEQGIFPKYKNCGRKPVDLSVDVTTEIERLKNEQYLTQAHPSAKWIHDQLIGKFGEKGAPSSKKLRAVLSATSDHERDWKTGGKRKAVRSQPYYGDCDIRGPIRGFKSFTHAQVDCNLVDLALTDSDQLWKAQMVDCYDGRILATHLFAHKPRGDDIRHLYIKCYQAHGRVPWYTSHDLGSENKTVLLQTALAEVSVILEYRHASSPRNGGFVESSFSAEVKKLLHNLAGNTKQAQKQRALSAAFAPENHAVWDQESVVGLVRDYVELRNGTPRDGQKFSPDSLAEASEDDSGSVPAQFATLQEFLELMHPFVRGIYRTVSARGLIKHAGGYYGIKGANSPLAKYAGKRVKVKEDLADPGVLYVSRPDRVGRILIYRTSPKGLEKRIVRKAMAIEVAKQVASGKSAPQKTGDFAVRTMKKQKELKEASNKVVPFSPPPASPFVSMPRKTKPSAFALTYE